jgi:predicted Fe-Mo cluster-binding NifX family protein
MKLIVTATAPDIDAAVDPRFGRGAYFIEIDTETGQWHAHENQAVNASGGAGSQAAQAVVRQGAGAVVSGDFGPNAHLVLAAADVRMYLLGTSKTPREAAAALAAGSLPEVSGPTSPGHHGGRGGQ